jgi:hypothetical protein
MSHDAHHASPAHDSHDSHGSHGKGDHGHAAAVDDGSANGPFGWPFAMLVGLAYLGGTLFAIFTPR